MAERYVSTQLRTALEPEGFDSKWITVHIDDVLSKFAAFRKKYPDAKRNG